MIDHLRFFDARDWFQQRRFGLFVHWGLYSIPAWQEQILWRGRMPRQEYEPLLHQFNPVKFDPDQWIDVMDEAGMEFLCFTSKHHDGFCMWDTKYTDYNIMNTPYNRDIVGMLSAACARRGKGFGLYYSIPDWHHRHYPNQGRHHEMMGPRAGDEPDFRKYCEYMEHQVTELMTNYGEINQLFWDVNVIGYNNRAFNDRMRALQPSMLINDRGPAGGDFVTPERQVPEGMVFPRLTEAVQSLGRESWGYRENEDYYAVRHLMQGIDRVMAMGGNYLLNVGPKADGTFDGRDIASLRAVGKWYAKVRESFEDTVPATTMITEFTVEMRDPVLLTRRGNTIYVHLYQDAAADGITLKPFDTLPRRATLLNTGEELPCAVELMPFFHRDRRPYLHIRGLPVNRLSGEVMVLKLEFDDSWAL
ncbi:MAG: alpha-L-fucosidase [Oscillospiraceae bacterium]|nr:alpha-L-fucosidase [Oscillospiraceae bacterium]